MSRLCSLFKIERGLIRMTFEPIDQAAAEAAQLAESLGITVPCICLPEPTADFSRWAVVACDQYTSQPEYWEQTAAIVGSAPSTLKITLPEIYLDHPGELPVDERIRRINSEMLVYLDNGTLRRLPRGWVVLDRATPLHPSRKGLVLAIDLEQYDFTPGNHQLIRATEGTVLERIPPRLAIRRYAPLELPHVMLLIDDPGHTVIEPMLAALSSQQPLYDTDLMQDGGHIRGWFVPEHSPEMSGALRAMSALDSLARHNLLFAVGDGNHSLATAKAHWENLRDHVPADHPARFALAEVVNIHDAGLDFEPIHRVVFGLDAQSFLDEAALFFADQDFSVSETDPAEVLAPSADVQVMPLFWHDRCWQIRIGRPVHDLAAGSLQALLDSLMARSLCRVDYIHGDDVVRNLAAQGHPGLLLPALDKSSFFTVIARDGILPRKTFSMGEANEKRYYMECREIR